MKRTSKKESSESRHKSVYIVSSQHFFFTDLFFKNLPALRPAFRFLAKETCLADMVRSQQTDLNLLDGRFWLKLGLELFQSGPDRERPLEFDYDWDLHNRIWRIRSEHEWKNFGVCPKALFKRLAPAGELIEAPFVPFIGKLLLRRNAIPNCARSESYNFLAALFPATTTRYLQPFGVFNTDQSLSHIPLCAGDGIPVHLIDPSSDRADLLRLVHVDINSSCKLRVHMFPFGLATSFLTVSLSASKNFSSNDLIALRKLLSGRVPHSQGIACLMNGKRLTSIEALHQWIGELLHKAIHQSPNKKCIQSSSINEMICINMEGPRTARSARLTPDVIGILRRDTRWKEFNGSFLAAHPSVFGKYTGEFVISSSDTLLLSFGNRWKDYHKRKSRVRFYWQLLSIYQFIMARKFLSKQLLLSSRAHSHPQDYRNRIKRIRMWMMSISTQHERLRTPGNRKFFHELSRALRVERDESELRTRAFAPTAQSLTTKITHPIHFEDFDGIQFERLVLAYHIQTEADNFEWYGAVGGDSGRDIWGERNDGNESICIQCVNRKELRSTKVFHDLDKVVTSPNGRPDLFRVVCSGAVSARFRDHVKAYAKVKGIPRCEVWSGPDFEERIRAKCEHLLLRFTEGVLFPDTLAGLRRWLAFETIENATVADS